MAAKKLRSGSRCTQRKNWSNKSGKSFPASDKNARRQQQQQHALDHFDRDDEIQRRRALPGRRSEFLRSQSSTDFRQQKRQKFRNFQPFLLAVVAVTDRHRVQQFRLFAERVEINRHAKRRAGLVLAARNVGRWSRRRRNNTFIHGRSKSRTASAFFTSSGLFFSSGSTPTLIGATRG